MLCFCESFHACAIHLQPLDDNSPTTTPTHELISFAAMLIGKFWQSARDKLFLSPRVWVLLWVNCHLVAVDGWRMHGKTHSCQCKKNKSPV